MPDNIQRSRMQQRRGSAEQWLALNPILKAGEIGYNTTDGTMKIGDGKKPWSALPIFNPDDGSHGFTGVPEAPMDGKDYIRSSGGWKPISEINIPTYNPIMPPAIKEVNANGELSLHFHLPYLYALETRSNAVEAILKRIYRFPFAEGRIKRISTKALVPGSGSYNVSVSGQGLFPNVQYVRDTWQHTNFNVLIKKDQYIEIELTGTTEAIDLQVDILIQVGNASLELIGEPDPIPNLYCWGYYQSTVNSLSAVTSTNNPTLYNQYWMPRLVICPSITNFGWSKPSGERLINGVYAKGEDATWYGVGMFVSLETSLPNAHSNTSYAITSNNVFTPIMKGANIKKLAFVGSCSNSNASWINIPLVQYDNGSVFLKFLSKQNGQCSYEFAALQNFDFLCSVHVESSSGSYISATIMLDPSRKKYKILRTYLGYWIINSNLDSNTVQVGKEYTSPNGDAIKEGIGWNKDYIVILTDNGTAYTAKYTDAPLSKEPRLEEFNVLTHHKPIKHLWFVYYRLVVYSDIDDVLWVKCAFNSNDTSYPCIDWTTQKDLNPGISNDLWHTWKPYKIGEFKVKRYISNSYQTFLLTEQGELFGCGNLQYYNMKNTNQYVKSFTRICENFVFGDIADYNNALIVIGRKLGDMP